MVYKLAVVDLVTFSKQFQHNFCYIDRAEIFSQYLGKPTKTQSENTQYTTPHTISDISFHSSVLKEPKVRSVIMEEQLSEQKTHLFWKI